MGKRSEGCVYVLSKPSLHASTVTPLSQLIQSIDDHYAYLKVVESCSLPLPWQVTLHFRAAGPFQGLEKHCVVSKAPG